MNDRSDGAGLRQNAPASQLDRLRARPAVSQPPALPAQPSGRLPQLVREVLDGMAAVYDVDGDDLVGAWENGIFDFSVLPDDEGRAEVLQVHGSWERMLPDQRFKEAVLFANEWNAEHVWPKVFVLPDDEGWLGLHGEFTADLGAEPDVDRVELAVNTGIIASLAVFDAAEVTFPDARLLGGDDLDETE
ncbi:YbjN domain-containing protein [Jiangella anatolica]|nr:YbjN domain-containing protein [Jiangella anatolica]